MGASTMKDSGPYTPTKSATVADTEQFSRVNTFAQEYTFDRTYETVPFTPSMFTTAASGAVGSGGLLTLVSGARTLQEVNTTGIAGVLLTTTKDQLAYSFVVPVDMDPNKEFSIRYELVTPAGIKYSKATDLVTTVTKWDAWGTSTDTGAAASTVMSDTTNTTTIPSAIYGRKWSDWDGVNDSAVVAASIVPGDTRINILTDFTLATNVTAIFCIGFQLGYYKRYQR